MNYDDKITELNKRLETISHKQNLFLKEIRTLRQEIHSLQDRRKAENPAISSIEKPTEQAIENTKKAVDIEAPIFNVTPTENQLEQPPQKSLFVGSFEQFIGENLISKIGVLILIIGVIIGAKYSIDNDLISPLTRIILGYIVGVGLLGFGIKLKEKYENYSAVLVSGSIAIMYFITYAAYDFYSLFPQSIAFAMMVMFTIFTVITSITYDKPIIAHIGLVGAYAVPFFLSNGSGDMLTFFVYISIINIGILMIAFKKYWKSLYYAAFGLTWLIFTAWFVTDYSAAVNKFFNVSLLFATAFFTTFYITFLAYKIIKKEVFNVTDASLICLNSFIYYGFGYAIVAHHSNTEMYLGLFTLGNAIIHFVVSSIIYKQGLYDKKLFYLALALVLVFITITIPVQLDGNWVTLLWTIEAALLFWIGRTKSIVFYEKIAYTLMLLSFLSIIQDWSNIYEEYSAYYDDDLPNRITPLFNVYFLTSVLFIASFGFINYLHNNANYKNPFEGKKVSALINLALPSILLIGTYVAFQVEISNYFTQLFADSKIKISVDDNDYPIYEHNYNILKIKSIWLINYTLGFLSILSFVNIKKIKNEPLGLINLVLNVLTILSFLGVGLYELSVLQNSFYTQNSDSFYKISSFNITLKYISFVFLGGLLYACYRYSKVTFINIKLRLIFDLLLHISILAIISSEFVIWMETAQNPQSTKLGLSIIWGVYSLIIISLGIWKNKKHLRIGAIALFAITLLKLFLYDISHLETIAKTIVLVALGLLLLIISFLYNKYKHLILEEEEKENI